VRETGKSIAQVARDLGINSGTLANWVKADREARLPSNGGVSESERELVRLRRELAEISTVG
jgi:transposase